MNKPKIIQAAIDEASKSTYKHKMGAVIFNGKRIIGKGYNKPCSWSRKLHPRFKKWPNSIHAEASCILSARKTLKGLDMLVVRVNIKNQLREARPCKYCLSYLNYVGIKTVYFTTNNYPYFNSIRIR